MFPSCCKAPDSGSQAARHLARLVGPESGQPNNASITATSVLLLCPPLFTWRSRRKVGGMIIEFLVPLMVVRASESCPVHSRCGYPCSVSYVRIWWMTADVVSPNSHRQPVVRLAAPEHPVPHAFLASEAHRYSRLASSPNSPFDQHMPQC